MSSLNDIVDIVQKFAETTSSVLNLDVEVVDDKQRYIAGTGRVQSIIGKVVKRDGAISKHFFEDKRNQLIIDTPGISEICQNCDRKNMCKYRRAIYTAIVNNDDIIGVLGVAACNEEQFNRINNNENTMLDFLFKIANLISTKVSEHEILHQLQTYTIMINTVYDNINKGLIVVNKYYDIVTVNKYICDKIQVKREKFIGKKLNYLLHGIKMNTNIGNSEKSILSEYRYQANDQIVDLLYTSSPIIVDDNIELILYSFDDYKNAKQLAYNITESKNTVSFDDIIGQDKDFVAFKESVAKVAKNDSTILLIGETGTGKELFARAIHNNSKRKNNNFITINCGAIPESLIESELFGYEKGSFTGANKTGKHGKFYLADSGTIFLDEVEAMPLYLQQKLLRVLENKEIERIGGHTSIPIDIRIISATNVRLDEMVKLGEFREDLFHRLNVISLFIPPLRERKSDILLLTEYFIKEYSKKLDKDIIGIEEEAKDVFLNYSWGGNVRELQNAIEYAINMENAKYITKENIPFQIKNYNKNNELKDNSTTLEEMEKRYIKMMLDKCGWDENGRIKAAKQLGISRSTIYRKIAKYGLEENKK